MIDFAQVVELNDSDLGGRKIIVREAKTFKQKVLQDECEQKYE